MRPHALILPLLLLSTAHAANIKVASISPLTGPKSGLGEEVKRGSQLALDEFAPRFRQLGHIISLTVVDDLDDYAKSGTLAERLHNDPRVLGAVGPMETLTAQTFGAAMSKLKTPLPLVNPTAPGVELTSKNWPFFNRLIAPDSSLAYAMAAHLAQTVKPKKVIVLSDDTTAGNLPAVSIQRALKKEGIPIAGYFGVSQQKNFDYAISTILRSKPDIVYYGGIDAGAGKVLNALRKAGSQVPFVGSDGVNSSVFVKTAGKNIAGTLVASAFPPAEGIMMSQNFVAAYKKQYGTVPNGRAILAYDGMTTLLRGILAKTTKSKVPTRAEVSRAIRGLDTDACTDAAVACPNITGPVKFNGTGERVVARVYILQYQADGSTTMISEQNIPSQP